jgi:hypothetical protein
MSAASPKRTPKRASSTTPRRAAKKSKITNLIPTVVEPLVGAEVIPADLRTLLKLSLPIVLKADKADRGSYEAEVVTQAEECLKKVLAELEKKHKETLAAQNVVIAPAEHNSRIAKKQATESALEAATKTTEGCKEAKKAAEKAVHDAEVAEKAAEKELAAQEKEIKVYADKKAVLADSLATQFTLLKEGTSAGAAGKKAVEKLLKFGKECDLDSTLLATFPITCKKPAATRSDFEQVMFTTLETGISGKINELTQKIAGCEAPKAQKTGAVAAAKAALEQAEAALTAAGEALSAAQGAQKEAAKEVSKATTYLQSIWIDMKKVCDAQDEVAGEVKNFKENILTAFEALKNKEPEPEPVDEPEPVEEAPAAEVPAAEVPVAEVTRAASVRSVEAAEVTRAASVRSVEAAEVTRAASVRSVEAAEVTRAASLRSMGSVGSMGSAAEVTRGSSLRSMGSVESYGSAP